MVDIILVILALALVAALVVMRRKPKAQAQPQPQVRLAVPNTAEPRQPGGRLAAALAAAPQPPGTVPQRTQHPMGPPQFSPVGLHHQPAAGFQQGPAVAHQSAPGFQQGPAILQQPAFGFQQGAAVPHQPAPGFQQGPAVPHQPAPGFQQGPAVPHQPAPGLHQGPSDYTVGGFQQVSANSQPETPLSPSASPAAPVSSAPEAGLTPPRSFPAPPSSAPQGNPTTLLQRESTAYLEVVTGECTGQRFPLSTGDNRIGRGPNNCLRLSDNTVSNQHAIIRLSPGQVLLFDDSSTNGTYVNGQRVLQPKPITHGDRITVGQTVLQLYLESEEASVPGAAD